LDSNAGGGKKLFKTKKYVGISKKKISQHKTTSSKGNLTLKGYNPPPAWNPTE
jgi:hypothetical protein